MDKKAIKPDLRTRVKTRTYFENKWFAICFIVLVTAVIYHNSLNLPFIFDDLNKIVRNPDIKQLKYIKTKLIYPYDEKYHIPHRNDPSRPLTYLTFTLNYHLGKLNPFTYHLFNVLMHIFNAILLFFLTRKTILYIYKKDSVLFPFFVALLFAVHTVNTSVVAYIFSRSDILATFFYVLSLLFFIKKFEGKKTYILSLICFFLSLSSKQIAVTLPAAILVFDYIFISDFKIKNVWKRKYYHLPFWIMFFAYIIFRHCYFGAIGDLEGLDALIDRYPYLMIQPYVILRYLIFLLVPTGLCYYHYIGTPDTLSDFRLLGMLSVTIGIFIFLYILHRKKTNTSKIILFSALWFFITLSPTSSFFPTTTAMVENRLYLSGFGFYILIVFVYFSIFCRDVFCSHKSAWILSSLIGVHILLLGIATSKRNQLYGNPAALWQEAISKYPDNVRAYNSLGNLYYEQEKYDKAIKEYQKALKIKPDYAEAHNNLGIIYSIQKEYDRAIKEYEISLKIDPGIAEAHTNLGSLYSIKKDYDRAIREYKKALEIDPNLAGVYYNLGIMYSKQKEYTKSIQAYQEVLKINPHYQNVKDKLKEIHKKIEESTGLN